VITNQIKTWPDCCYSSKYALTDGVQGRRVLKSRVDRKFQSSDSQPQISDSDSDSKTGIKRVPMDFCFEFSYCIRI